MAFGAGLDASISSDVFAYGLRMQDLSRMHFLRIRIVLPVLHFLRDASMVSAALHFLSRIALPQTHIDVLRRIRIRSIASRAVADGGVAVRYVNS